MKADLSDITWARRLKLRHLEMLLVLERAGGITAAAEILHLTQPGVSHWLLELEEVVGCPLFIRGRKLTLTLAGQVLLRQAERILGDVRRVDDELKAIQSGLVGRLQIGCVHSAALVLVPGALSVLHNNHPNVAISVEEDMLSPLLERLHKRELDLVVGAIDLRAQRYNFVTEVLMNDTVQIVCKPDHPLARKRKPTWQEALEYPWVLPPTASMTRMKLDEACAQQHVSLPLPRVETGSVATIHTHLRGTECLGAVTGLVASFYKSIQLLSDVSLKPAIQLGPIGAIWSEENASPILREMVNSLKTYAQRAQP